MAPKGYGFREVIIDQPSPGKWIQVDMNLGTLSVNVPVNQSTIL